MTREAGVLRDAASLERAATELAAMAGAADPEIRNLVTVSSALVDAARARTESRGTHTRLDFPEPSSDFLGRFVFGSGEQPSFVPIPEQERAAR
jgi:L-aspartate oxidase